MSIDSFTNKTIEFLIKARLTKEFSLIRIRISKFGSKCILVSKMLDPIFLFYHPKLRKNEAFQLEACNVLLTLSMSLS